MTLTDYGSGRSFIESMMLDACIITRDFQGSKDDVLDTVTGQLYRPVNDVEVMYTGKCSITLLVSRGGGREGRSMGGIIEPEGGFKILIPVSVTDVRHGDMLTVTAAVNDQYLLGQEFRITDVAEGTHRVYRRLLAQDLTYSPKMES